MGPVALAAHNRRLHGRSDRLAAALSWIRSQRFDETDPRRLGWQRLDYLAGRGTLLAALRSNGRVDRGVSKMERCTETVLVCLAYRNAACRNFGKPNCSRRSGRPLPP